LNDEPQMDLRAAKKFREGLVSYLPLLAPTEEQTRLLLTRASADDEKSVRRAALTALERFFPVTGQP